MDRNSRDVGLRRALNRPSLEEIGSRVDDLTKAVRDACDEISDMVERKGYVLLWRFSRPRRKPRVDLGNK